MIQPYTPRTHQVFWCNRCDCNQVDSTKPETGTFHVVFGHSYSDKNKEYDGEYLGVMFALCKPCSEKKD